jgi:hypothetical protein
MLSESLVEVIVYSLFNSAATAWILPLIQSTRIDWLYYVVYVIVLIGWPVLLHCLLQREMLRNKIISIIPTSWDYFFNKRVPCFMLVHLNNGRVVGGLYNNGSFASSYPEKEDLYLEEVWKINSEGKFIEKLADTKGLLVNHDSIEYIELFNLSNEGEKNNG